MYRVCLNDLPSPCQARRRRRRSELLSGERGDVTRGKDNLHLKTDPALPIWPNRGRPQPRRRRGDRGLPPVQGSRGLGLRRRRVA